MKDRIKAIKKLCDGLLFPSESDEPITVTTGTVVRGDDFFAMVMLDNEDADKWRQLKILLGEELTIVKVPQPGGTVIDIRIFAELSPDQLVCLHTWSVET